MTAGGSSAPPTPASPGPSCSAPGPRASPISRSASAKKGYLVSREGSGPSTILRTSDSGATWAPQVVVSDPIGAGGIATGPDATDYLLAGTTDLLFTTTGGGTGTPSTLTIKTPKTKLKKAATITVTGKLSPAQAGRVVTVSFLPAGSRTWQRTSRQDRLDRLVHDVVEGPQGHEPVRRAVARRRAARRRRQRRADRHRIEVKRRLRSLKAAASSSAAGAARAHRHRHAAAR